MLRHSSLDWAVHSEPGGETTSLLAPYNVNTQSIRTRFWDGHDHFFRDDVTLLKGHHLLNFGGQYQHNFNWHQRSDNGGGINFTTTYQIGDSAGAGDVDLSALTGAGYPTGTTAARDAAMVYGMVTNSQVAYTRSGEIRWRLTLHLHTRLRQEHHPVLQRLLL